MYKQYERTERIFSCGFCQNQANPLSLRTIQRAFSKMEIRLPPCTWLKSRRTAVLTTTRKRPNLLCLGGRRAFGNREGQSPAQARGLSSSHLTTCTGPWGNSKFSMFRFLRSIRRTNGLSIEVRSTGSSRRTCPESWWSGSTGFRSGRSRPTWKWEKKCLFSSSKA